MWFWCWVLLCLRVCFVRFLDGVCMFLFLWGGVIACSFWVWSVDLGFFILLVSV